MHATMYKGIVFVDDDLPEKQVITTESIQSKADSTIKNLADVRELLTQSVQQHGGNCLCQFKIGQTPKDPSGSQQEFYGSGTICTISNEQYQRFVKLTEEEE